MLYTLTSITQVSQTETIKLHILNQAFLRLERKQADTFLLEREPAGSDIIPTVLPHRWTLPELDTSAPQKCDLLCLLCPPSGHGLGLQGATVPWHIFSLPGDSYHSVHGEAMTFNSFQSSTVFK